MARYTRDLIVAVPLGELYKLVSDMLKGCGLEILYVKDDYFMAREVPGNVSFSQLVTVEVLVDRTRATLEQSHFNLVVKNEALPLKSDNHCRQVYQMINQAISENQGWNLISSSTADPVV